MSWEEKIKTNGGNKKQKYERNAKFDGSRETRDKVTTAENRIQEKQAPDSWKTGKQMNGRLCAPGVTVPLFFLLLQLLLLIIAAIRVREREKVVPDTILGYYVETRREVAWKW